MRFRHKPFSFLIYLNMAIRKNGGTYLSYLEILMQFLIGVAAGICVNKFFR